MYILHTSSRALGHQGSLLGGCQGEQSSCRLEWDKVTFKAPFNPEMLTTNHKVTRSVLIHRFSPWGNSAHSSPSVFLQRNAHRGAEVGLLPKDPFLINETGLTLVTVKNPKMLFDCTNVYYSANKIYLERLPLASVDIQAQWPLGQGESCAQGLACCPMLHAVLGVHWQSKKSKPLST